MDSEGDEAIAVSPGKRPVDISDNEDNDLLNETNERMLKDVDEENRDNSALKSDPISMTEQ